MIYLASTKNKRLGFTLLELIMAITIAMIIFLSISYIYTTNQKVFFYTDTKAETMQNGRVILDRISRELRQAEDMVTSLPADNSNPETLPEEIMFQDGHDSSTITYIRYYLDGSNINRQSIVYYFESDPDNYVYWHATDQLG